jgi:hypothetical protein
VQQFNRAQIVAAGSCRYRTGIDISHLCENDIRLIFGIEWTETQAIAHTSILGTLQLIDVCAFATDNGLCGQANRRGRCAEINHERSRSAEPGRFGHGRKQIINAKVPNIPG